MILARHGPVHSWAAWTARGDAGECGASVSLGCQGMQVASSQKGYRLGARLNVGQTWENNHASRGSLLFGVTVRTPWPPNYVRGRKISNAVNYLDAENTNAR